MVEVQDRVQVGNKPWWLGRLCLGSGNVLATAAQERGKKGAEQEVKLEEQVQDQKWRLIPRV